MVAAPQQLLLHGIQGLLVAGNAVLQRHCRGKHKGLLHMEPVQSVQSKLSGKGIFHRVKMSADEDQLEPRHIP